MAPILGVLLGIAITGLLRSASRLVSAQPARQDTIFALAALLTATVLGWAGLH